MARRSWMLLFTVPLVAGCADWPRFAHVGDTGGALLLPDGIGWGESPLCGEPGDLPGEVAEAGSAGTLVLGPVFTGTRIRGVLDPADWAGAAPPEAPGLCPFDDGAADAVPVVEADVLSFSWDRSGFVCVLRGALGSDLPTATPAPASECLSQAPAEPPPTASGAPDGEVLFSAYVTDGTDNVAFWDFDERDLACLSQLSTWMAVEVEAGVTYHVVVGLPAGGGAPLDYELALMPVSGPSDCLAAADLLGGAS